MPDDTPPPITIPGWTVIFDDGLYTAVRDSPVSEYQALNGALPQVCARTPTELVILASAQTRLYQDARAAERVACAVRDKDAAETGHCGGPVIMVVLDVVELGDQA